MIGWSDEIMKKIHSREKKSISGLRPYLPYQG
jgi:hypothetical protein